MKPIFNTGPAQVGHVEEDPRGGPPTALGVFSCRGKERLMVASYQCSVRTADGEIMSFHEMGGSPNEELDHYLQAEAEEALGTDWSFLGCSRVGPEETTAQVDRSCGLNSRDIPDYLLREALTRFVNSRWWNDGLLAYAESTYTERYGSSDRIPLNALRVSLDEYECIWSNFCVFVRSQQHEDAVREFSALVKRMADEDTGVSEGKEEDAEISETNALPAETAA
jgi:hypothetical protein